ncbi:MAG TPA: hypothetical protein V6C93_21000 [Allocoleopsis sp.]
MNRFIGVIIMAVAVAALAGAAIGWRFPFLGRNQSANRLETPQQRTVVQPAKQTRTLGASQPNRTTQALNSAQTTAQAPDATTNPDATNPPPPPSNTDEPVPALW